MALTVKDILELPCGQKLTLLAGREGLERPVVTAEIADYEFDPDLQYDAESGMDPNGFVITSFLFAKHDPSLILHSVRQLYEIGMACLAFKPIIYAQLPPEVLDFADENDFPIFCIEEGLWFENIVFDIMYAVQFDDKVYLAEEKIDTMLKGAMTRSELDIILKGISLRLLTYVSVVFISGDLIDTDRILRAFYLLKGFHGKGLLIRYADGLFLITTSARAEHRSHDLIRREAFELLGIPDDIPHGMSEVHRPTALDRAFRESRDCYLASLVEGKPFGRFRETGICRILLAALDHEYAADFTADIAGVLAEQPDLSETAREYVAAGGDVPQTAGALHCHQNTVRYRLGRIRELTGLQDVPDSEFYLQLKAALLISRAKLLRSQN